MKRWGNCSSWHWGISAWNGICRFRTGRLQWISLVLSLRIRSFSN